MTTLDELRAKVTAEQGIILNTIWRHFAQAEDQNESWIRAGILYHRLGKGQKEQTVHATLATLGGTIVYETTDYGNGRRYGLTFLGMLLTEQGREIESMLGKALGRIRDLFLENPSGKMNVKEIAKDIGLNETQSSLLLRVFPLSGFFSGGGSLESAGWPREIDDLVHVDDFEAHIREEAMQKFDPSVPVDSDPVSRALYAAAVEEYRQSISKNDQLGRVPMIGARSVGRESFPTMQIESSGNNSVAAHTIIGSNIYIGADAGSSAEKRTPAQEFEYRSKKAMERSLTTLTGTEHFYSPPELEKIEELFRAGRPVLLSGEGGSGKSAIGGRLAEAAFKAGKGGLLLDARNAARIEDEMGLRRHFGSSNPLSEVIGEIGRARGFRLIIDQVDNVIDSIAADLLVDLARECKGLDGVDVVVISRNIEDQEGDLLQPLVETGFVEIESHPLREEDVAAILEKVGITNASPGLIRLGQNLLNLEIVCVIKKEQPKFTFATISDEITLWNKYVEILRRREGEGGRRENAKQLIRAATELARRCLMASTMSVIFDGPLPPLESRLEGWHIIIREEEEFIYRFKHEKFQDYLYSRLMCGQGKMPDAVLTEIDRHRVRGILPLMQAIYKASSSPKLEPFLRNTLLPDEIPFFAQTAVLKQYIRAVFSEEDVKAVLVIIEALQKNSRLREWFFRNRPSALWAPLLFAAGFLDEAPPPIEVQGGYRFGSWDAQEYLVSVAGYVPQVVLAHFEKLNGHPYYFERAIYALRLIPVREADKATPSLLKKLADPEFVRMVGEEAFELTTAMAKADLTETAFALFRALTVPQPAPKPRSWEYEGGLRMFFNSESVALLPTKEYHQVKFWRPAVNELARLDIERLVAELERLLLLTLRIQAETENRGEEFDRTSYWRIAVEETGQDHGEKYKDLLTELLRDNLDRLADRNPAAAEAIVDRYLDHEVEILRRLGLYLLWRFPGQFRAQVNKELFDPVNVDDPGIHHEYFMLLQHGYPHLDPEEKGRLEQMILAGPDAVQLKKMAEWANMERGEDPEAYAKRYRKRWIQERLWMIREYLAGEASSELHRLTDELGEPDHPAFTHWSSGARGMSSVSPIPAEELREMPPESLIVYLRDWKQGVRDYSRGIEESIEALSREVAETILSDPDRYGEYIDEIARLRPTYATALIDHYFDGRVDPNTLRRFRLSLIKSLLADETIRRDLSGDYGTGWVAFRYAAVGYVKGLMEQKGSQFPTEELPFLRDILITLVEDPDPDSNADRGQEDWTEHNDPLTVAISHVRPKALNVLIDFACYVARRGEGEDQKGFGPKRLEPMIEQTLTRKLDWRADPSLSVHSIFGRCLNQLCWLDLEWAKTRLDDIFPEGEESASAAFFTIAWFSFVTSGQGVYAPVFDLLREKYGRAIDRLKNRYEAKSRFNPMEGFAFHLIVEYLYADYELHPADGRQNLIVRFFNELPAEARGYAVKKIAPEYQHSKKDERLAVKHWQRIRALWQWRLNQATLMDFPSGFKGEMEWFSELLDALPEQENIASMWPILQGPLHYVEQHDWLWSNLENYLSREVNGDPVRAIQFFGAMHDRLERIPHDYSDEARAILEVGAARAESRSETLTLLERIAKGGYDGFDHLYDKYAGRR